MKVPIRKNILLKVFPNLLFINLSVIFCVTRYYRSFNYSATFLSNSWLHQIKESLIKFYSTFTAAIGIWYVVLFVLLNTLTQFQILVTIFVLNQCVPTADMMWIAHFCWNYHMGLSFAIHKQSHSVETWRNSAWQ